MDKIFEHKNFHIGLAVVLSVLILLVYSNTFNASFHFDDTPQIVDNYQLRDLKNIPEILVGHRGITMATFAINYAIGGHDVTSYHVFNIAIHIINGILAYFVIFNILTMLKDNEAWAKKIAAFAALLFVVHPLQTQAVTYIVQRMESLASLFYLLTIMIFIKAVQSDNKIKKNILYGLVVFSYIAAFKTKEIAITIPAIIFLFDYLFVNKGLLSGVKQRLPLYGAMVVVLVYFIFVTVVPSGGFGDLSEESAGVSAAAPAEEVVKMGKAAPSAGFGVESISPKEYLYTQFNVMVYYITLIFVPINQNLDYDFPISRGLFEVPHVAEGTVLNYPIPPPIVSLLIILGVVGFAFYSFYQYKNKEDKDPVNLVITFFILWFFIILSPTSSFIPIIDVIFEHRVYLPLLGIITIFVIMIDRFFDKLADGEKQ